MCVCIYKMQIETVLFMLQQSLQNHLHFAVTLRPTHILTETGPFSLLSSSRTGPTAATPGGAPWRRMVKPQRSPPGGGRGAPRRRRRPRLHQPLPPCSSADRLRLDPAPPRVGQASARERAAAEAEVNSDDDGVVRTLPPLL